MRRLLMWAPQGRGERLLEAAARHGGTSSLRLAGAEAPAEDGAGAERSVDVVITHLPNEAVSGFVDEVSEIGSLHVSMLPQGALALEPPPERAPRDVADVTFRSPLEIVLASLQSVGSWRGFLAYALISGWVVWVGLFTNTIYLLVAAMLISPLAGPAMNAAIATARGDRPQLVRGLARYLAALGAGAGAAAMLTPIFGLETATELMVDVASISVAAVVLPLVAGAAGAVNLVQSERSSLVSGAATGMLVAAALAPPMGIVGMSLVLGEWDLLKSAAFLLGLQLVGINLSGAVVFRLAGVRPRGVRYERGRPAVQRLAAAATVLLLAGFVGWQFADAPDLQRETLSRDAEQAARRAILEAPPARPVEVSARFTRGDVDGQDALLIVAYAQAEGDAPERRALEERLSGRIARRVRRLASDTTPLVDVTVLGGP